jgi:[citrate (pro-3S)-lyase] ligase
VDFELEIRRIYLEDAFEKEKLLQLLQQEGLELDATIEYTMGIYKDNCLVATGSFYKNTLRCLAVDSEYQGLGLMNKVVSHLQAELAQRGEHHLFLYTKSSLGRLFKDLGFYEIACVENVVIFMENKPDGVARYKREMAKKKVAADQVAAIVMNANPFTLGHQYLVEKTAQENEVVHLFVVSEEASIIPFETRYELIAKGVAHLPNVILHSAGAYMVSKSTFPSYFLNGEEAVVIAHAKLDLEIFLRHVVPTLGITRRYVGEEPYCKVTRTYIETMHLMLQANGVGCEIIPRLEVGSEAISASMVRACIRDNRLEDIKTIVPKTTYDFFKSERGQELIEKMKHHIGRH